MKILYLFNRTKGNSLVEVQHGREADNHFFGMLRLKKHGVQAESMELEESLLSPITPFLRKHILNIHFVHLPLFFRILRYDIVFTSTAFGLMLTKVLLGLKKPKWVMFDFNIEEIIGDRIKLRQKVFYHIVSKSDGIITISKSAAEAMRRMFPEKEKAIAFIHLGTDTSFFKPNDELEGNYILSPGRDPGRDYGTLLKAVSDLPIEVKVTAKTEHLKKAGVLTPNVHQYDFSNLELRDQYARAKIIILPLKTTPASNNAMGCSTVVEAMAMGKAIIATDTQTMQSYITNGVNGILVPAGDEHALRRAIEHLLSDTEKRKQLGVKARAFAEEYCNADDFAMKLSQFFLELKNR